MLYLHFIAIIGPILNFIKMDYIYCQNTFKYVGLNVYIHTQFLEIILNVAKANT